MEKEIKLSYPELKVMALNYFLSKKESSAEQELKEQLEKLYEKTVPAQARELLENGLGEQLASEPTEEGQQPSEDESQRENGNQTRGSSQRGRTTLRSRRTQPNEEQSVSEAVNAEQADENQVQDEAQEQTMQMGM
ncbi:MAG: DUF6103 family protein [Brevinema sp.]